MSLSVPSLDHAPALIHPSPLAAGRYVVLNSGHTFHERELATLNYLLFPRLGDWAVIKVGAVMMARNPSLLVKPWCVPGCSTSNGAWATIERAGEPAGSRAEPSSHTTAASGLCGAQDSTKGSLSRACDYE